MSSEKIPEIKLLLVAVDGSSESLKATRLALSIARSSNAEIVFVSVAEVAEIPSVKSEAEDPQAEEGAQLALGMAVKLSNSMGVRSEISLKKGHPANQILRCAQEYAPDIIVLGSRGRSGAKGLLLGSVSAAVSKSSEFPVLIVK
jgi:nucleotide-binding universal stress UspA family protein